MSESLRKLKKINIEKIYQKLKELNKSQRIVNFYYFVYNKK